MPEAQTPQTTTLFRVENPIHPSPQQPDGTTSHKDVVGQWFTPDLKTSLQYLHKSTQTFGTKAKPVDGAQLVVAHVPTEALDKYHVTNHPIAARMDVEPENYLIPRDGSVPLDTIALDDMLADLKGKFGTYGPAEQAAQRIEATLEQLGHIALEQ